MNRLQDAVRVTWAQRMIPLMMACGLLVLLVFPASQAVIGQDDGFPTPNAPAPYGLDVLTYETTRVYAGPGATYPQTGLLPGGETVRILERSYTGNWLHIVAPGRGEDADGDGTADDLYGWILTGYVDMTGIRLSLLDVNPLPDGDPDAVASEALRPLVAVPVVPRAISADMLEVYAQGQTRGIDAAVVTKVGDSNSANRLYLTPLSEGNYDLGPYDFLGETAAHFAESLGRRSVAAQVGLNAFSVFDPFWANSNACNPDETPLACEYRVKRPLVAVILFGPNDLRVLNSTEYEEQMRLIVEETLAAGVIPVLSTFSANPEDDIWPQAVRFNTILVDIAAEYAVPVVNLWLAAAALDNRGIGADNVHLTAAGESIDFSAGREARFGVPLQNLIVLHTLDVIRQAVTAARPAAIEEGTGAGSVADE